MSPRQPSAESQLASWWPVLSRAGVEAEQARRLARRAFADRVPLLREALASGLVAEETLYRALAEYLELDYVAEIDPRDLIVKDEQLPALLARPAGKAPISLATERAGNAVVLHTDTLDPELARHQAAASPSLRSRWIVAAPSVLRRALWQRAEALLVRSAVFGLLNRHPDFSARMVANAWQGLLLGIGGSAFAAGWVLFPHETFVATHVFFSLFFLACIVLRFCAVAAGARSDAFRPAPVDPATMPVYTVLVALYREAEIVPELLAALGRLQWPRGKLDVKLVCEQDDAPTLAAIRAFPLRSWVEVVEVPPVEPRTKPKALAYALPAARGEFVVLYDAEDKPHPFQLIEAWQRFRDAPRDLACLQAPLEISNGTKGILPRMFAFEYAALFRGLLPFLSRAGLVMPLGGTSNHFRRKVLEEVGGWDPFNVTEDADLGLRLARFGYRIGTITLPTHEQAPETRKAWVPQRTRWFKGWAQTWLVHMRFPVRLLKDLGLPSFLIVQVLCAGMVLSAIAHPFLLLAATLLLADLVLARPIGLTGTWLMPIDIANIALGYLSFLLLGWQTLERGERKGFWKVVCFTPIYWLLMSWAALRAVWQLWRRPHLWEKTPHTPERPDEVEPRVRTC